MRMAPTRGTGNAVELAGDSEGDEPEGLDLSVIEILRQLTMRTDCGRRLRSGVTSRKATLLLTSS